MALLRHIFCCFPRASSLKTPEMAESVPPRPVPWPLYQNRADEWSQSHINIPSRAVINGNHGECDGRPGGDDGNGYTPVIPLPRYTPRPLSIREKTVEAHMRHPPSSPSPSSSSRPGSGFWVDEKQRYDYEPSQNRDSVTADDVSSAFSFQSSYGNTSTATRETPPPPYSPMPSRPTSLSISSGSRPESRLQLQQPIAQPPPVWSPRGSIEEVVRPRVSGESR